MDDRDYDREREAGRYRSNTRAGASDDRRRSNSGGTRSRGTSARSRGSTGEKHHACTADQGSFFGKRSFGNGLAVPGTYVVVPRDFHMITFDQNI